MTIKFINNWKYKGNWSKFFHLSYSKGYVKEFNIIIGIFNFFLYINNYNAVIQKLATER